MERLKVGVAGLGRIGWNFHARNGANHSGWELAAVTDVAAARREQAREQYGCAAYEDFDAMLRAGGLDVVVIATPTHLHREMALAALGQGLHVILEKPMALDRADAEEIVHAAASAKRKLTVYQPHRLAAYFQHLRHIVESGRIGQVYWVRRAMFRYVRRNDWQSLVKFGGGMLNNYGAHAIDQVLALIGFDVPRLFCDLQRVAALGDAEDVVKVVMKSAAGPVGEVEISQASVLSPYHFVVWGSCGGVMLCKKDGGQHLEVRWFDPAKLPPKELDARLEGAERAYPSDTIDMSEETLPIEGSYGIDLYEDFAASIREDRSPAVRPEESVAVMDVLDRCRADSGGIHEVVPGGRAR